MQNIIQGYNFLFLSNKEISVLEKQIIKDDFIPKGYKVDDVIFDEFLITSWDINHRTPRFFSKWAKSNVNQTDEKQDYDLTLDEMTLASSATPTYFYPYEKRNNFYISGDNIATSPSMYAV